MNLGGALFITTTMLHLIIVRNFVLRQNSITGISKISATSSSNAFLATSAKIIESGSDSTSEDTKKKRRSLHDSVKPYKRHVIVCHKAPDPSVWPRAIEDEKGTITGLLASKLKSQKTFPIMLTACLYNPSAPQPSTTDLEQVIVYPEGLIVDLHSNQLDQFSSLLFKNSSIAEDLKSFSTQAVPWKKLVLCCVHGNRDRRCHEHGPKVIAAMKNELKGRNIPESEISIFGSSHIGGHEFAGTMITYPQGDWYGYLTEDNVGLVVDSLQTGVRDASLDDCYRGNCGCSQLKW